MNFRSMNVDLHIIAHVGLAYDVRELFVVAIISFSAL